MIPKAIHAILKWNPTAVFNRLAPDGIKLWINVLKKFPLSTPESYSWWGKLSISGNVGMQPPELWEAKLNNQINEQRLRNRGEETHLYMYCSDFDDGRNASLHVGKIEQVIASQNAVPLEDPHVPTKFYKSKKKDSPRTIERFAQGKLIPYWFKLSDIRHLAISERYNLWECDLNGNPQDRFDPVGAKSYPCGVIEKEPRRFFDPEELEWMDRKAWWEECRDILHGLQLTPGGKPSPLGEVSIPKRAEEMAVCVAPLLRYGREILFIDPYFDPRDLAFVNSLKAFLDQAFTGRPHKLKRLQFHLKPHDHKKKGVLSKQEFEKLCWSEFHTAVPRDLKMSFIRWEDPHNRYILTDIGGCEFSEGTDESKKPGAAAHIKLLEPQMAAKIRAYFRPQAEVYRFVDEIVVTGERDV